MADKSQNRQELQELRAEIRRLKDENKRLTENIANNNLSDKPQKKSRFFPKLAIGLFVFFAVSLLFVGNILFWTGNTLVKTDRYTETVQPLIREPEIQNAVSSYATQQLYKSIDVEALTQQALPPQAAFLAPSLADKLQENTQGIIQKILASPKFEDTWNNVQENAHARFISGIQKNGSDGALDINELYGQINEQLKSTKLAFLADKSLPPKIGSIQLVEGAWISNLQTVINNIDTWRTIALLLLLILSVLAIWLSRNKRKVVITLGLLFSASMFVTLIIIRVSREVIAGRVDEQYAAAAGQATQTILYPLAVQSATILVFGLLVAFVAWISGPSKNASWLTEKIQLLFGGKLHGVLFSKENGFTLWMGRHKRIIQWAVIVLILSLLLFIRLTPAFLLLAAVSALVWVLLVEVLSADTDVNRRI